MLEEILKEIEELKIYKQKYEYAVAEKQLLSDKVYEYEKEKFDKTTPQERHIAYKNEHCNCCRYNDYCEEDLPEDIGMPIKSDKAWFPSYKSCKEFEWS